MVEEGISSNSVLVHLSWALRRKRLFISSRADRETPANPYAVNHSNSGQLCCYLLTNPLGAFMLFSTFKRKRILKPYEVAGGWYYFVVRVRVRQGHQTTPQHTTLNNNRSNKGMRGADSSHTLPFHTIGAIFTGHTRLDSELQLLPLAYFPQFCLTAVAAAGAALPQYLVDIAAAGFPPSLPLLQYYGGP